MRGHEPYMREALTEAVKALANDEVPVGAVIVGQEGRLVGRGFNRQIGWSDPTAHAEVVALRDAARTVGNYRLNGAVLYVTVEPCLMCAGALVHSRIAKLVYGVPEPKAGAIDSVIRAFDYQALNHRVEVVSGILEDDCRRMIQAFFEAKRQAVQKSCNTPID